MIIKDGIKMELVMPLSFNDRKTDSAPFEKKPDKGKRGRAGSEADRWKTRSLWGLQVAHRYAIILCSWDVEI